MSCKFLAVLMAAGMAALSAHAAVKKGGKEYRYGELIGMDVIVSSKDVPKPAKLRYLHSSPWTGTLFSEVNLPVGAFHIGF